MAENDDGCAIKFCIDANCAVEAIDHGCLIIERHATGEPVDSHAINNALQELQFLESMIGELRGHLLRIQSGDMNPEQAQALT
jgi:hypothetical protein